MVPISFVASFRRLLVNDSQATAKFWREFQTTTSYDSRMKTRHTHKPYFHIKKTAKHADEPLTASNVAFLKENLRITYEERPAPTSHPVESSEGSTSPLRADLQPWSRGCWEPGVNNTRVGLLGMKIGVVPMWLTNGRRVSATLIQIEDNHVVRHISAEEFSRTAVAEKRSIPRICFRDKPVHYDSLVVGALSTDPAKFTKDYCGLFTGSGVMPKKIIARMPVTGNALIQPGTPLNAGHFQPGQYVDVTGRTTRRGFQGVMKRWGFSGMPSDARGVTKSHRRPGCIGSGREKSRVWPGQKMPGHVGGHFRTERGLKILRINYKHNVIYVRGHGIPGEPGEMVKMFDSKLTTRRLTESPRFFPTCYPEDFEQLPEEEYAEGVFKFDDPSIRF